MSEPENRVAARLWLRYAREDLDAAEKLIKTSAVPRHACFLAQQAAEKAIKAILVLEQAEFPRSHDLEALVTLVPEGWRIRNEGLDLSTLTEWAIEARYPGDWPDIAPGDAETSVGLAKKVLETVAADFATRGLRL
jgi:HEPN domain-containing protein